MSILPPAQTPLNQHSLLSLEVWLDELGAQRSEQDRCSWILAKSKWSAEIKLKKEELIVVWCQEGCININQCSLPYVLPRDDVEAAILQGP